MKTKNMNHAVVFIKREKDFFEVPYAEFKFDEVNNCYLFELAFDDDNSITETILKDDFDSLTVLDEKDIKKLFSFSDTDLIEKFHNNTIRNSFIVKRKGIVFDKNWFLEANKNILGSSFEPELVAFWSYLMATLVISDAVVYKEVHFPRFCTECKELLANASLVYKNAADEGDVSIINFVFHVLGKLPDIENPKLSEVIKEVDDYVNYAERIIDAHVDPKTLSKEELKAFKKGIHEGVLNEYESIMDYYAYCCYGGDSIFECDWKMSEKLLLKLIESSVDLSEPLRMAEYCNTLGYIYYYGRTNNGNKQLDKARHYFERAALLGHAEAKMKLYDIYVKQKQGNENTFVANKLLNEVIEESFLHQMHTPNVLSLPDAMFRRGIQYQELAEQSDSIDDEMMYMDSAFYYQLIAYRAILQRQFHMPGRYGDNLVKRRIQNSLKEVVEKSHFKEIADYFCITMLSLPQLVRDLINKPGVYLNFKLKQADDGTKLVLRMFSKVDDEPLKMCICVPECWYCNFVDELELEAPEISSFGPCNEDDSIDFNEIKGRDLFLDGEYSGSIDAKLVFLPDIHLDFYVDDEESKDEYLDDNKEESTRIDC